MSVCGCEAVGTMEETVPFAVLEKFGKIKFVGSYALGLQMNGDIDIHVLRDKSFTKDETLVIFNEIVRNTKLATEMIFCSLIFILFYFLSDLYTF